MLVGVELKSVNITLLVLTRIGPGFSGSEMSAWRVDSCTLTCEGESEVFMLLEFDVIVIKLDLRPKNFGALNAISYLRHSQCSDHS